MKLVMKKRLSKTGKPRVRLLPNGRTVLTGLNYRDLESLVCAATINTYDSIKKNPEERWYQEQLWICNRLKASMDAEKARTFDESPKPSLLEKLRASERNRKFWRNFEASLFKDIKS